MKRSFVLILGMTTLLAMFQNCAPVMFSADRLSLKSEMTSGSNDPNLPGSVGPILPGDPDAPVRPIPPVSDAGPTGDGPIDSLIANCSSLELIEYTPFDGSSAAVDQSVTVMNGDRTFDQVRDLSMTSVKGNLVVRKGRSVRITGLDGSADLTADSVRMTSYAGIKANDRLRVNTINFEGLTSGSGRISIRAQNFQGATSTSGELCIRASNFTSVTSIEGAVELIGDSSSTLTKMGSLTSVNGTLILKNIDLDRITSVSGKLVLINSRVRSITSASNKIYLQNSSVDSMTSSNGFIKF